MGKAKHMLELSSTQFYKEQSEQRDMALGLVSCEHDDVQQSRKVKPMAERATQIVSFAVDGWIGTNADPFIVGLLTPDEQRQSLDQRLIELRDKNADGSPFHQAHMDWIKPESHGKQLASLTIADLVVPIVEPIGGQQRVASCYDARVARIKHAFDKTVTIGNPPRAVSGVNLPTTLDGLLVVPVVYVRTYTTDTDRYLDEVRLNTDRTRGAIPLTDVELLNITLRVMGDRPYNDAGLEKQVQSMFPLSVGERESRRYLLAIHSARELGLDPSLSVNAEQVLRLKAKGFGPVNESLTAIRKARQAAAGFRADSAEFRAEQAHELTALDSLRAIADGTTTVHPAISVANWGKVAKAQPANRALVSFAYCIESGADGFLEAMAKCPQRLESLAKAMDSVGFAFPTPTSAWLKKRDISPPIGTAWDYGLETVPPVVTPDVIAPGPGTAPQLERLTPEAKPEAEPKAEPKAKPEAKPEAKRKHK